MMTSLKSSFKSRVPVHNAVAVAAVSHHHCELVCKDEIQVQIDAELSVQAAHFEDLLEQQASEFHGELIAKDAYYQE